MSYLLNQEKFIEEYPTIEDLIVGSSRILLKDLVNPFLFDNINFGEVLMYAIETFENQFQNSTGKLKPFLIWFILDRVTKKCENEYTENPKHEKIRRFLETHYFSQINEADSSYFLMTDKERDELFEFLDSIYQNIDKVKKNTNLTSSILENQMKRILNSRYSIQ